MEFAKVIERTVVLNGFIIDAWSEGNKLAKHLLYTLSDEAQGIVANGRGNDFGRLTSCAIPSAHFFQQRILRIP